MRAGLFSCIPLSRHFGGSFCFFDICLLMEKNTSNSNKINKNTYIKIVLEV